MEEIGKWRKSNTEEYTITQGVRGATIFLRDNQFQKCDFITECEPYNYDDWMFLKMIAEKISEIIQEKLKSKVES